MRVLIISEPLPGGEAITPGGAAQKAGMQDGDIVLEIENKKITEKNPVEEILQKCKVGQTLNILGLRHGKKITFRVSLDERK